MLEPAAVAERWIDAFNARAPGDLLDLTHPGALLVPLRLDGVGRRYHGHDGARLWLRRMRGGFLAYSFRLEELRAAGAEEVGAVGRIEIADHDEPVGGWMLFWVGEGEVRRAHHYLTDPADFPSPLGPQHPKVT